PSILVVGLGNYTHPCTRHSVGQSVVESLAARLGINLKDDRSTILDGHVKPIHVNLVLVKPRLLMNVSGKSVALAFKAHIQPKDLSRVIVIHDSLSHKPLSVHPRLGGQLMATTVSQMSFRIFRALHFIACV
ncbi:peptidyl-tRNA hydrolase, partial [Cantharellus anzutake]|uniref:peptidyl-tRNA hydrolase n=1 Tax=Cantharellus anzutake TaxID=1750568 RepID=UPI0019048BB8